MSETLTEVRDLFVKYPVSRGIFGTLARQPRQWVHAVDGVSFTLQRGKVLALVGESGCGKTSTAQALLRLINSSAGTIRFRGEDITNLRGKHLRALRREMQMIYQDPYESLNPRFRVRDIIEEPILVHQLPGTKADRHRRIARALRDAGLTPPEIYFNRYPHELSGGQRQRVAIAASLIVEPSLLVADEPVSMLDVSVRAEILALLGTFRTRGLGILLITHDLSTAAHYADRIAVMYLGRIVEEGPANLVTDDPQHPYTKALISVVPKRDPRDRDRQEVLRGEAPNPIRVPSGCRFHPRCPVMQPICPSYDPPFRVAHSTADGHEAACVLVGTQAEASALTTKEKGSNSA